jgi:hypothetical protein
MLVDGSASALFVLPAIRFRPMGRVARYWASSIGIRIARRICIFWRTPPGFKTLITQVFVPDDDHLDSDVVFGVTSALIGDFKLHDGDSLPAPDVTAPWYTLDWVFVMEPGKSVLPKPPLK